MKKQVNKIKNKPKTVNKLAQILAYFKRLSLHEKFFLVIGPVGLFFYFFPGLQELGFYKVFLVVATFVLIEFFARRILRDVLKYGKVTQLEATGLMLLMFSFIVISALNLHLDKGLHIDELWRIDRGRQFIVFNDYDYGNFIGYPIDKTLVGFFSLFGIFDKFQSIREIEFLQKLSGGDLSALVLRLALGVIPSSLIIWHLFPILKKQFSAYWAWLGVILLLVSFNFLDYSRTFLSEPLLGYLFSLLFALFFLIFDEKDNKKREFYQSLLLPLFTVTFLTKYTAIIALPVVFYMFLFGKTAGESLKRLKTSVIYSLSIFLGFLPYIFTFDGFIALARGPVRGIFSSFRSTVVEGEFSSFIPVALIFVVIVFALLGLLLRNFARIYAKLSEFFLKNYNAILLTFAFIIVILGFFEDNDFISLYHYGNLLTTDLAILVFSTFGVLILLFINIVKKPTSLVFFATSSVFLLTASAYLAVRITDVFPRHIFPYLFILIILAIFALNYLEKLSLTFKHTRTGFLLALPLVIQLISFAIPLKPHETWNYEYWQLRPGSEASIKDLAAEIRSEIGSCQGFIFDEAEPFWSQHLLGGIAYYYSDGDCKMQPDTTKDPFKKLKVIDFYLRKKRFEQLENPHTLGLYSNLVPLIASKEVEPFLTDDEIVDEYVKNTNAKYLVSKRNFTENKNTVYELQSGKLTYKDKLKTGYFVYRIDRNPDVVLEYKRQQQEEIDAKNYKTSTRQMVIEAWKPERVIQSYPSLFEYVATTGPVEIDFGGDKNFVERNFEVITIDRYYR